MSFLLSKLLWELLRPSTLLYLLAVIGLLLLWTRRDRWGRYLLAGTLTATLLPALLPLNTLLALPLENRFPNPEPLPHSVDGIVVLGGAELPSISVARAQPTLNGAAERIIAAVALARRYPEARLVFTGGSSALLEPGEPSARVAAQVFRAFGLPASRLVLESRSRNTYENALFTKRLVTPEPGKTWLLVTSAVHMPRAVGLFRSVEWPVTPYPVDYGTSGRLRLEPSLRVAEALDRFDAVAREWVGLVSYRLLGRTASLLPAP